MGDRRSRERGVVSLFIVIFTALLVTIVTASFVQIMMRNLQASSNSDLSQSAYDAAMAGVEDAKRGLVALRTCDLESSNTAECNLLRTEFNKSYDTQKCTMLGDAKVAQFDNGEVQVGTPDSNQGYTCVKVQMDTDYQDGKLTTDEPATIPLRSKGAFDKIRISWFSKDDLTRSGGIGATTPTLPAGPASSLPNDTPSGWPATAPALLRTQLIQFRKGNLKLAEFDKEETTNARTLFLYPATGALSGTDFSIDDRRKTKSGGSIPSQCSDNWFNGASKYACQMVINVPTPEGGSEANREAYLQLQALYNDSSYKVELLNGTRVVSFDGIRPMVDSTGRASDQFRRVRARVSVSDGGLPITSPQAALSLDGNLCKNFFITKNVGGYTANNSCRP